VETDSVKIDFDHKEATFTVKRSNSCELEKLKKVVADTGRGKIVEVRQTS
jgi:hypothetical protein